MEKINFINNQPPYINAENLNAMQDNIGNDINNKSKYGYFGSVFSISSNDDLKNRIITDEFPIGCYLIDINRNGTILGAIVQKASNNYLSFILFGYYQNVIQYKYNNGTWTEWNANIESGSNENGNWIKYSDGTMICWKNLTTEMAINAAYGSLYQNSHVFDFPQQFIETPVGVCSMFQWGTGASWGCVVTISTTQITCRGIDAISRDVGTCKISYMAIGKWK